MLYNIYKHISDEDFMSIRPGCQKLKTQFLALYSTELDHPLPAPMIAMLWRLNFVMKNDGPFGSNLSDYGNGSTFISLL